jgi:hypothetical protein
MTSPKRVQPDRLHDLLMDRVDDWVENALDPQGRAAALRWVLAVCRTHENGALRWEDQLPVPPWIGEIRQGIADSLGVSEDDGGPDAHTA